jgi:hypothetical protein
VLARARTEYEDFHDSSLSQSLGLKNATETSEG